MKKLLYTLLIGLVIISCQPEDDYGQLPVAISADVTLGKITKAQAFEFINNSVITGDKGKASTSKTGTDMNSIQVAFISAHSDTFAHMVSEDDPFTPCFDSYSGTTVFDYIYNFPNLKVIDLSDNSEQDFTLSSGLETRYNNVFGQSLNNMFYLDYAANGNPSTRTGAQPSRNDDNTFSL